MGIGQAFSRVKESVRRTGLDSLVAGLGEQLRSRAIPAPLRPAAARLADLLHVSEPREVVSLTDAIEAHAAHAASGVSEADMAAAAGVCPFSGMNAGLAGLLDASQFENAAFEAEIVHEAERVQAAPTVAKPKTAPARKTPVKAAVKAAVKVATKVASGAAAKSPAKVAAELNGTSQRRAPSKVNDRAQPATKSKKSQPSAEKDVQKVAAKPASSKTPARSKASTSKPASVSAVRPAAKRPIAKAATKKD